MKSDKKILIAFILNLSFAVLEIFGGIFTSSVAILSDAVHDLSDAFGIGLSYFFERKSKKASDGNYTFGYARFSVIGGAVTTLVLILGSLFVIFNAVSRIINPAFVNYNGMIFFALVGILVNMTAVHFTHGGHSLNERAVNLHMLEDALGWIIVLIGALVMRLTDFSIIDPILSIGVSLFILLHALKNIKSILNILLEKAPDGIDTEKIKKEIAAIGGVEDIYKLYVWSLDGDECYGVAGVICDGGKKEKEAIRDILKKHGIFNITIEFSNADEKLETAKKKERHCHHH